MSDTDYIEPTNEDRAARAEATLVAYIAQLGDASQIDDPTTFQDLLTDLMHLLYRSGTLVVDNDEFRQAFSELVQDARNNFEGELEDERENANE